MKVIFLSSSDISVETINSIKKDHELLAIVTSKDKPRGRGKEPIPNEIATYAISNGIKVYKTDNIDSSLIEELKLLKSDIFVTFAFGLILKKEFFEISRLGGINIHPSLLPDLRGPSPIQAAILKGYTKSGVTIQKMALKVDSGDILFQTFFDISEDDNEITVEKKVSSIASSVISKVLTDYEKGKLIGIPQDHSKATYCKLIKKEDGLIDWSDSCVNINNKIRAFVRWPIAYSFIDGTRINIYKAEPIFDSDSYKEQKNGKIVYADKNNGIAVKCGIGLLKLIILQMQGKKQLHWKDFLNGFRDLDKKQFNS